MRYSVLLMLAMATSCHARTIVTVMPRVSNSQQICCSCSTATSNKCCASLSHSRGFRKSSRRGMRTWRRRWPVPLSVWRRRKESMPAACHLRRCSKRFRRQRVTRMWKSRKRKRRQRQRVIITVNCQLSTVNLMTGARRLRH